MRVCERCQIKGKITRPCNFSIQIGNHEPNFVTKANLCRSCGNAWIESNKRFLEDKFKTKLELTIKETA